MPACDLSQPESSQVLTSCCRLRSGARNRPALRPVAAALFAASLLSPGTTVAAQTSPVPAALPAQEPASAVQARHPIEARSSAKTALAATLAQPKPPDWPADNQPSEATVVWDSHGLRIEASNSSLAQILKDVSAKTGAKLEGMGQDERIFGAYGPGPARDVLFQLLDGSGYNVLMIGDQGQGTPRRIVLSVRPAGTAHPAGSLSPGTSNDEDTDTEPQPQQPVAGPQPAPVRVVPPPGVPVRTPQQYLQEMLQRQQQRQSQQSPQN
jgi:hypothetical protein